MSVHLHSEVTALVHPTVVDDVVTSRRKPALKDDLSQKLWSYYGWIGNGNTASVLATGLAFFFRDAPTKGVIPLSIVAVG